MSKQLSKAMVKYKPLFADSDSAFKTEYSLDTITFSGYYLVEINHNGTNVGLPVEDCGETHYIVATLVVTDSGTEGPVQNNRVIGQVLTFTSRKEKETKVYCRTLVDGKWSAWRSLAVTGMFEDISSSEELVATVAGLVDESIRAKQVEVDVMRTAVDISSLAFTAGNGNITITGKSMDGEVKHSIELPTATTEKAGVMSAEDKNKLNSIGTNEYDALYVDRRTDGFAYHMSDISLGSTYEGKTIARNTCSICKKITLEKGQKISYKSYAENLNAVIITDVNNNVIFLSGAYTIAKGEYTATDTCYIYCTAYTNLISSDSYHCTVSASGMKATVERLESHVNILQSKTESFMQGYRELFVNGVFFADFEQGVWTGFGEVGEKYVEKITKDSPYSHYKFNVNKGTRLKYRLYAGGYYNIVATDTNGVILHKIGDSANWANHEGEYVATEEVVIYINQAVTHATAEHSDYYAISIDKDIRPRIDVLSNDSETEIWHKLKKAFLVGGYDIYFESATYTFKSIYDVWKSMNRQSYELPIGGGCNYYCNGSTFISVDPESGHEIGRAHV